jgi:hypothetical protein
VILNRQQTDQSTQLASSLRALENLRNLVRITKRRGYDVVLVGMPGEGQLGSGVMASTRRFDAHMAWDVAPLLLDTLGFPASKEMPGGTTQHRIATYGPRATTGGTQQLNDEYYENLKSLGYIR